MDLTDKIMHTAEAEERNKGYSMPKSNSTCVKIVDNLEAIF